MIELIDAKKGKQKKKIEIIHIIETLSTVASTVQQKVSKHRTSFKK